MWVLTDEFVEFIIDMEYCIEARALKSSFLSEYAVKSTQPAAFFDELMCANGISGVSCDDFSVDVFLDLSNEELLKEEFVEEESEEEEKDSLSDSSQDRAVEDDGFNCSTFSGSFDCGSISAGELSVPVDDLEHLEWLSQIVDDSASELSLLCPTGTFKENTKNRLEPVSRPPIQRAPILCFPSPVPAKARSKRSRLSGPAWSRASSSLSESSSTPSSSCGSSPTSSNPVRAADWILEPVVKKQKKRPAAEETGGETGGGSQTQRRCSHCQVQKTPQWRTGPLGAKTLCNACGVRYKSGRLFPEYRPACSPTFSGDVHSNSHRKVLEMRRHKDVPGTESGLTLGFRVFETNVDR